MKNRAFTFIELMVVLAIVAFLVTIFLRALANTEGSTLRTQCLNNLRQLGIGLTLYANDNKELLVPPTPSDNEDNTPGNPPNPPFVQYAIFWQYTNALNGAGIPLVINAPSVWCCPDIPDLPYPDTENYPRWVIGYQYLGGITEWTPNGQTGVIPGTHSPVKLTQSRPYWCLAADLVAKINGAWGGIETLITAPPILASEKTWPPHREGTNAVPVGGNEVFVDGSASWCTVGTMHNFTSFTASDQFWFYQNEDDLTLGAKVLYNNTGYKWTGN
jgi:prepilin-type N-terminal cleavage/methylation domain-containing protein